MSTTQTSTPASLGYAMPAEWSPHRATWLAWPHNVETWPARLTEVQEIWIKMIEVLSPQEEVCLLVNDDQTLRQVRCRLENARVAMDRVSIIGIPTVDVWMRDYGPTFVTRAGPDQPLAFNDWIFNGWGGKYRAYEEDDRVAKEIAALLGVPVFEHSVVLEGGSIDVNGAGTCLTTEQCLLNKNRNPMLSREDIERLLKNSLGVAQVVWLGEGIVGDDTDGHIDDIARFVSVDTIVCSIESNPNDANYRPLKQNYERLTAARDLNGHKFTIVELPCPDPLYYEGSRLPASYANFYIANETVMVPVFDDPGDDQAIGILRDIFADRRVIGLRCATVVAGLGALHCVTQQEPAFLTSRS